MHPSVQKVTNFLMQHPGEYYCDKSLSELTSVRPRQQVNQITRPLSVSPEYPRVETTCAHCGKRRTATAYVPNAGAGAG